MERASAWKKLALGGACAALLALWSAAPQAAGPARLTVRVLDAETGRVLPARLILRASDGSYPGDRLALSAAQWPHIEAHGVFTKDEATFELPPGKTEITAAHGLEYRAERQTVTLAEGGTQHVELKLRRVFDMRKAGWVSGDLHVHMLHGENERKTSYDDVATTCAANGLDFVYVGQEYAGAGTLDLAGYEAECEKVSTDRFRMFLGAERPKNILGHQVMLGVRNPFLISEDVPYHPSARKVRAQGGALVYVHPVRYFPEKQYQGKWLDFPGNNMARELVFDAFTGPAFDGLSVLSDEPDHPQGFGLWFTLLNRGLFVPVFADSDACFDRRTLGMKVPGFWNTYFYVGPNGRVEPQTLTEAVRRGRTLASTGPLLQYSIEGQLSGATLPPDSQPRTVKIDAWLPQHAFSLEAADRKTGKPEGISRVELIRNGQVVKAWEPHTPEAHLTHTITENESCWYVARVFGEDRKWQVAVASPIYFAAQPVPQKHEPFTTLVRGRIYDFQTGAEAAGTVEIRRDDRLLKSFPARGKFRVRMPLDAEIVVRAEGSRPQHRSLLMDHGPIHRFLWYLQSRDLADPATFDGFQKLIETVDLEFPVGYRMPGSYFVEAPAEGVDWSSLRVVGGPEPQTGGTATVAAVLMDTEQIGPGDSLQLAAIYRSEGNPAGLGPLVVEARGYDPSRPTAYGELKTFATFEKTWSTAVDLGDGYRLVAGTLRLPEWVEPGPTGGIDIAVRARQGHGDASFLGFHLPLGPTRRALSLTTNWRTMPVSWPDRRYGIGPFRVCNRIGRDRQPRSDYRRLRLQLKAGDRILDLQPSRDARGCPDADDALYTGHFLDQVLAEETRAATPDPIRPQPRIDGWEQVPTLDLN